MLTRNRRTAGILAAVAAVTTALVWGPTPASAAPETVASPYAPSALVLTFGQGESGATTTPERAVTLTCAYAPNGTHPTPAEACDALQSSQGGLSALTPTHEQMCTFIYHPVTVTLQGVWRGHRVDEARTFSNSCIKDLYGPLVRF
ncbi:subtilase-type protease inhibitor [Streptomyces sp. NBC_00435]|uniref:subtilase-type protease inhibitor n=1 Tax=Streptomyces sp. NBC_00435 TaxID=2903649 RepID=UPI002E1ED3EF